MNVGPQQLQSASQSVAGFAAMFDETCNFKWVIQFPSYLSSFAQLSPDRFVVGYQNADAMVLSVLDATGTTVWSNTFAGNVSTPPIVSVGPDGNIYALLFQFAGTVTFNGGAASSNDKPASLLAKFDPNGGLLFDVVLETDAVWDYSVSNDIWVTGDMGEASMNVGSDVFEPPNHLTGLLGYPQTQGYLMRLSTTDGHLIGGTSFSASPYRVVTDPCSQRATVLATVNVSADFGLGPVGGQVHYSVQFDQGGYPIWNQPMNGQIALDGVGNVLTVNWQGWETHDNVVVPGWASLDSYDLFGNERFSVPWTLSSSIGAVGLMFVGPAVGSDGTIGVAGMFGRGTTVDVGLGPLSNSSDGGLGELTAFFARLR